MSNKVLFIFLGLVIALSGGCRTLREKFTREPKRQEAPVYVSLREYPDRPSRQVYIDYYLYTRGWLGELTKALERGISHKRQKYAAGEALMNFEQIISFFNQEGQAATASLHEELRLVYDEIERIPNLSQIRRDSLVRKVQSIKRSFSSQYTYTNVKEWLD